MTQNWTRDGRSAATYDNQADLDSDGTFHAVSGAAQITMTADPTRCDASVLTRRGLHFPVTLFA